MTDKELQDQINRAKQDAITLDYTKWSFERRQRGYSADHDLWQRERDAVLSRQRYDNDAARQQYLSKLEAEKEEKRREYELKIDAELEPQKQRLKHDWLANNPSFSEADFESKAWVYLRQNLLEEREANAANAEIERQLSTGRY